WRRSDQRGALAPCDDFRKLRRGRHDELPRKAGKSEHQAGARTRRAIETADRAHDDAGAPGGGFDREIGRAALQISDEVHALVGKRDLELAGRATLQSGGERVALLAIELAHAADMGGK